MDGVCSMTREFSSSWNDMNEWKWTVENFEEGLEIKYLEKAKDGIWEEKERINISHMVAERFFKTIAKDYEDGNIETFY